jgi:hypothetical protein
MSLVLLSTQALAFDFPDSKTSTRKVVKSISPPQGTRTVLILLQSYNLGYGDGKQYGFGEIGINLTTVLEGSAWSAVCVATLKDDKRDQRAWNGNVVGVVQYFGPAS